MTVVNKGTATTVERPAGARHRRPPRRTRRAATLCSGTGISWTTTRWPPGPGRDAMGNLSARPRASRKGTWAAASARAAASHDRGRAGLAASAGRLAGLGYSSTSMQVGPGLRDDGLVFRGCHAGARDAAGRSPASCRRPVTDVRPRPRRRLRSRARGSGRRPAIGRRRRPRAAEQVGRAVDVPRRRPSSSQRPPTGITGHSNSFTGDDAIVSIPAAAYASTCSALVSWVGVARRPRSRAGPSSGRRCSRGRRASPRRR